MYTIAILNTLKDSSALLQIRGELIEVGKWVIGLFGAIPNDGHFLVTTDEHGHPPHLTAQVFSRQGDFLGGVHFDLKGNIIPTFRPFDTNKSPSKQPFAMRWINRNFLEESGTYTVI
ncbi:hypothetical protein BJ912DRAFT_938112 [Pholiota molesta]|nr:hypothetical protein BJ912DRAFT_938112 [Pholiota molesta]